MLITKTRRGDAFEIVASRSELDTWDFERCQNWIQRCDPNAEVDTASCEYYGTTVEDLRDMAFELMQMY